MANRSSDFNYKVALASGLKSLQTGRLRAAEEQFRYLTKNFPAADGGYRGLAKVLVEQEDRAAALRMLLEGGAALAKADRRGVAIQLYKEATMLAPMDLTAHRRLAAAYALSGDLDEAAHEYVRFIANAMTSGDMQRAKLEAAFALERLPGKAEIEEVAKTAGADIPPRPVPKVTTAPPPSTWTPAEPARETWNAPITPSKDAWAEAQLPATGEESDGEPIPEDADAPTVEATAAQYLANGDQRGGQAALEAARRYLADGKMAAASDLLLQLIAGGVSSHEAQRLLVEVTKGLGKSELTKTKLQLLIEALKLDGKPELAAEVEQLAQAL